MFATAYRGLKLALLLLELWFPDLQRGTCSLAILLSMSEATGCSS